VFPNAFLPQAHGMATYAISAGIHLGLPCMMLGT
jgi:hypothetical protein